MADTTVTNKPNDIIDEVVATLLAGTISSANAFNNVEKANSVDRFKETRLSGSDSASLAAVINGGVEEFIITDENVGNVLSLTILICSQSNTESNSVTSVTELVAAVKNLLNGDVPDDARGFYAVDEEEFTQLLDWDEPEYDTESKKNWAFAELPCRIAFVTTTETSH